MQNQLLWIPMGSLPGSFSGYSYTLLPGLSEAVFSNTRLCHLLNCYFLTHFPHDSLCLDNGQGGVGIWLAWKQTVAFPIPVSCW